MNDDVHGGHHVHGLDVHDYGHGYGDDAHESFIVYIQISEAIYGKQHPLVRLL